MNLDIAVYLIISLFIGVIIGVIFTCILSPKSRNFNTIKKELTETKSELAKQKEVIVKHFSQSAEILDNMAKEFRHLYKNMAENSGNLLSKEEIKNLNKDQPKVLEQGKKKKLPPKDYTNS